MHSGEGMETTPDVHGQGEANEGKQTDMRGFTRAEWMGAIGIVLNLLTIAYLAGVVTNQVSEHERRLGLVETQASKQTEAIARIDANVTFLTDLAREDRQSAKRDGR